MSPAWPRAAASRAKEEARNLMPNPAQVKGNVIPTVQMITVVAMSAGLA
jgi:hypothetical protein